MYCYDNHNFNGCNNSDYLDQSILYDAFSSSPKWTKRIISAIYYTYISEANKIESIQVRTMKSTKFIQTKYPSGEVFEEYYVTQDGEKHGLYESWHRNGNPKYKCTYTNGVLNGLYTNWWSNGQRWEEYYCKDGRRYGQYRSWYYNGEPNVYCAYNENGNYDGPYMSWYNNGKTEKKCIYDDGVRNGRYIKKDYNGRLELECTYNNGLKI